MIERFLPWAVVGLAIVFLGIGFLATHAWKPGGEADQLEALNLLPAEQTILLRLARQQIEAELRCETPFVFDRSELPEELNQHAACFVGLYKGETLRGCMIDAFEPHESLVQNVLRNAVLAATGDERFPPIRADELPAVHIEISVLGPLRQVRYDSADELITKLSPGIDGVVLTTSNGQSAYLPWVWERFSDPGQFLTRLCEKQGATADCWQTEPYPMVEVFRVTHFSEAGPEE